MSRLCRSTALCAAGLSLTGAAQAQGSGDGMYGRVSGDVALQLDAGGAMIGGDGAMVVSGAARYLQSAGLYASFSEDFRRAVGPAARSLSLGVELRPLFIPRMGWNWEKGPATLDLLIDSLSLRLGAVVSRRPDFELDAPGLEAAIALGVPLTRSAAGPWVTASAGVRWSDAQLWRRHAFELGHASILTLTLGWQGFVGAHAVDAGDRLRR